jgi:hypothetical protein
MRDSVPRDPRLIEAERRLAAAQDKVRRKAMGPALPLSDAALDQATMVGEADAALAAAAWDRDSGLPGLLDATVRERS